MTEKNYNPNQKEKNAMKKQSKANAIQNKPKKEDKIEKKVEKMKVEEKKIEEEKIEDKKIEKTKTDDKKVENKNIDEKKEEKKTDDKKTKEIKKPSKKIKKEEVYVNAKNIPISTKYAISICKFVKGKRIGDAIRDLEQVVLLKKAVPMKGEYAHKKGKGIAGGKYPQRASKHFIILLKSLAGNANNHEMLDPVIAEASANWAPAPRGRFGRVKRKRSHIRLKAVEIKVKENKTKESKK